MTSSLYVCIIFLFSSWKLVSACSEDSPCRELAFPSFLFFADKRLLNHTTKTVEVQDLDDCELLCYKDHNCVSINFENRASEKGKYSCELNNSTHEEHDRDLVEARNYFYRGTKNACGESPCKNGGTCQSGFTKKRYRCLCPPGFMGCNCSYDIDECAVGTHSCSTDAVCINTKGSYNCKCNVGHNGDGRSCTDVDECSVPELHKCDANAICKNTKGSYICSCKQGYVGDGRNCTDHCEAVKLRNRIACGMPGIEQRTCVVERGCCYDTYDYGNDTSPCFYPSDHKCHGIIPEERVGCSGGHSWASKEDCELQGCCYDYYSVAHSFPHCFHGRQVMMDSVIISNNGIFLYHLGQFLAPVVGNNSQWKLCYRASTHGRYDLIFHAKCDGKNNTVTTIKKNEYVFGGFTDIPWEGIEGQGQYRETSKAFIFSLRNKEKLGPFKGMVKKPAKAIYNQLYMGPKFGKTDIRIDRPGVHSTTQLHSSYSAPRNVQDSKTVLTGTYRFEPDEVEVFYLD